MRLSLLLLASLSLVDASRIAAPPASSLTLRRLRGGEAEAEAAAAAAAAGSKNEGSSEDGDDEAEVAAALAALSRSIDAFMDQFAQLELGVLSTARPSILGRKASPEAIAARPDRRAFKEAHQHFCEVHRLMRGESDEALPAAAGSMQLLRQAALYLSDDEAAAKENVRAVPAETVEKLAALRAAGRRKAGGTVASALSQLRVALAGPLDMIFEVAARARVPVFIHLRRGVDGDPAGLFEALALARTHGAALHVAHVSHSGMSATGDFLAAIRAARADGVDVTTEVLPYNAGSAPISSAVFGRDWRAIFGIDYGDVEWAATGERFDEATFLRYREQFPTGQVIHHYLEDAWTRAALAEEGVVVVSDLLPMESEDRFVAPHNGAFTRVLGRYVREAGVLTLPEAVARMTWLPARRLEAFAPAFASKGRVQVGADADLTVFDPARVLDRATYRDPYQPPLGLDWVIVGGELVVDRGALVPGAFPGRRVLAAPDAAPQR